MSSIKKTALTAAVELWPGWIIPYFFATLIVRSAIIGNGTLIPIFSFIARTQARWADTLSTESPTSWTLSATRSS